jgi:hypothetical protein
MERCLACEAEIFIAEGESASPRYTPIKGIGAEGASEIGEKLTGHRSRDRHDTDSATLTPLNTFFKRAT